MKGGISMTSPKNLLAVVAAVALALQAASAFAITSIKTANLFHNNNNSPFFATTADAANTFAAFSDTGFTFTPVGAPRAGDLNLTSLTSHGVFSITGNSTSAGGWTNGNGVPTGLTLTFNADVTFSVGAGSPAGSVLTLSQNGANRGDGLGITQTLNGVSTIETANFNGGVGNEVLAVSAVTVSDVVFGGTLSETGFTFAPGTVGNFGPYVLRSPGFTEAGETAGLLSANNAIDPGGLGRPTIGFGVPSGDPSEIGRGQGFVASNVSIENGFANTIVNGNGTYFERQPGAFTLAVQNATMAFKGIGYQYDVTFDITPIPPGDYNKNGVVDAADYALWRKGDLAADSNGDTVIDQIDYDFWRANFGNGGPGAGAGLSSTSVPEPSTLFFVALGMLATCSWRRLDRMRS